MILEVINKKHLISFDIDENKCKYLQMQKVTVLMREDQKHFLDVFSKQIMKDRIPDTCSERITTNTVLRALIDAFIIKSKDEDFTNLHGEKEVLAYIKDLFR